MSLGPPASEKQMRRAARTRLHLVGTCARGFVNFGNVVPRVFTTVPAKHSKLFYLIYCVSVGVDRRQRSTRAVGRSGSGAR
jgi:hypothetical protein